MYYYEFQQNFTSILKYLGKFPSLGNIQRKSLQELGILRYDVYDSILYLVVCVFVFKNYLVYLLYTELVGTEKLGYCTNI